MTAAATVGLVVGATYPAELGAVRARCPELPILLPGVGAQAGDLEAAVRAGVDAAGAGLLVSSSRAILYAGEGADFAEQAREATLRLRHEVNAVRSEAAPAERATERVGPPAWELKGIRCGCTRAGAVDRAGYAPTGRRRGTGSGAGTCGDRGAGVRRTPPRRTRRSGGARRR